MCTFLGEEACGGVFPATEKAAFRGISGDLGLIDDQTVKYNFSAGKYVEMVDLRRRYRIRERKQSSKSVPERVIAQCFLEVVWVIGS